MTATEARDLLGTDLRAVVAAFADQDELRSIDGVDWNLELGAITEMLALRNGPALMFDRIKGYPAGFRVLSNLMNNPRRVGMLFGLPRTAGGIEIVRTIRERFTKLDLTDPVEVRTARHYRRLSPIPLARSVPASGGDQPGAAGESAPGLAGPFS